MTETVLYEDPWVRIDTVTAYRGDGQPYPHRRVTPATAFGALVVPRLVLRGVTYLALVDQARPAAGIASSLEVPRGGTRDLSESEAARELEEETGLTGRMRLLGRIRPDTGLMPTEVGVWLATIDSRDADVVNGRVEWESGARCTWLSSAEVHAAVLSGRITCGMSVAALGLAALAHVPAPGVAAAR